MKVNKGLITDTQKKNNPDGSWVNARNICMGDKPGDVANERGFDIYNQNIPYDIIGKIELPDRFIVFSTDDNTGDSAIGVIFNGVYTQVIDDARLNFKIYHPIEGVFKYNSFGEIIISFWEGCDDDANPTRYLNVTNPEPALTAGVFDSDAEVLKLRLYPYLNVPTYELGETYTDGALETGAYMFCIQYELDSENFTSCTTLSNPIYITELSARSFNLSLTNIDQGFNAFRLLCLIKTDGVVSAQEVGRYNIADTEITIIVTGNFTDRLVSLDDILVPNDIYEKNGSGTYFRNKLILGNLCKDEVLNFQPYANNIKVAWKRSDGLFNKYSLNDSLSGYDDPNSFEGERAKDITEASYDNRYLMPGAVYAFYIALIMNNGTESPLYHIPGRRAKAYSEEGYETYIRYLLDIGTNVYIAIENAGMASLILTGYAGIPNPPVTITVQGYTVNVLNILNFGAEFRIDVEIDGDGNIVTDTNPIDPALFNEISVFGGTGSIEDSVVGFSVNGAYNEDDLLSGLGTTFDEADINSDFDDELKVFHTRDTATGGLMGFWENKDEVYPDDENFDVYDLEGNVIDSIGGENVRHHVSPSIRVLQINSAIATYRYACVPYFSNVLIPDELADKVQGYRIYYAIRNIENQNVVGNSVVLDEQFDLAPASRTNTVHRLHDESMLNIKNNPSFHFYRREGIVRDTIATTAFGENLGGIDYIFERMFISTPYNTTYKIQSSLYIPENNTAVAPSNEFKEEHIRVDVAISSQAEDLVNFYDWNAPNTYNTILNYVSLRKIILNMYNSFYTQNCASTLNINLIDGGGIKFSKAIRGFDTFMQYNYQKVSPSVGTNPPTSIDMIYPNFQLAGNLFNTFDSDLEDLTDFYLYNVKNDYLTLNIYSPVIYNPYLTYTNKYPYRVARSLETISEQQFENWRFFRVEDIYDKVRDKGEITHLENFDKYLIIHFRYSLYVAFIKDKLDDNIGADATYVGEGDLFDREPSEILDDNRGLIGCDSKYASFTCKYGYISVDRATGRIFLFNGKIEELSAKGIRNQLIDTLGNTDNTLDNPYDTAGITGSFDERMNRVIFSKTDINSSKEFTISYDFGQGLWVCFHDYLLRCLLRDRKYIYGIVGSTVFKLNSQSKVGIYVDQVTIYPSYIDIVIGGDREITKKFNSFNWQSIVERMSDRAVQKDETFTSIVVYNNNQCSSEVPLRNELWFDENNKNLIGYWTFNEFVDVVIDPNEPIILAGGIINASNININQAWFEKSDFISNFVVIRLIYSNPSIDGVQRNIYLSDINLMASKVTFDKNKK